MGVPKSLRLLGPLALVTAHGVVAFFTRQGWLPLLNGTAAQTTAVDESQPPVEEPKVLKLSAQARKNLGLVA